MKIGADSLRIFIGIAEAIVLEAFGATFSLSSGEGDDMSAGVEMMSEKMISSRFMASGLSFFWSDDFRNWAMPLGAVDAVGAVGAVDALVFCRDDLAQVN